MTALEQRAARALAGCSMLPASRDKYFGRWLGAVVRKEPARELTPGARKWLWKLVWRYRRQIGDAELVQVAMASGEPPEVVAASRRQRSLFL